MPNPRVRPTQTTTYTLAVTINGQTYTSQATISLNPSIYVQNLAATYVAPAGTPAYEIGRSAVVPPGGPIPETVIDASQAPYGAATNNTVVFDGRYNVKGNVRLINGTFRLNPSTVFYVDGYGHEFCDICRNYIQVENGSLYLTGATLRASCDEMWAGVSAGRRGNIYATSSGAQRTVLRDMQFGLSRFADYASSLNIAPLDSHFYVENTDFINNNIAVMDGLRTGVYAQSDYLRNCNFSTDQTASPLSFETYGFGGTAPYGPYRSAGVLFNDYDEHGNNNPAATPLRITGCTFDRLQVGIMGSSSNLLVQNNTFSNCWYAAAYSQFTTYSSLGQGPNMPATPPKVNLVNNTVRLPETVPPGYSTTIGLTVCGVVANEGFSLRGNTFSVDIAAGTATRRVGVSLTTDGTVGGTTDAEGNKFLFLNTGIEALGANTLVPTRYEFSKNFFDRAVTGILFRPHPTTYNYGLSPSLAITIRCNSFSVQSSAVAVGIQVQPNTKFIDKLGTPATPNGNSFYNYYTYPATGFDYQGSDLLTYYSYLTNQEFPGNIPPSPTSNFRVVSSGNPTGACGGSVGVNLRADTPNQSAITSADNSMSANQLTASAQQSGNASAAPTKTARLKTAPDEAAERLAANRYEQVLTHQRQPKRTLAGRLTLNAGDLESLRQVAASGTAAAYPACQLLRFYDPNCRCVLASDVMVRSTAPLPPKATPTGPVVGLGEAHPNPAAETVAFAYAVPAGKAPSAVLLVRDLTGRQVLRQALAAGSEEITLSVRELPAGLYVVVLEAGGQVIGTRKLAVAH